MSPAHKLCRRNLPPCSRIKEMLQAKGVDNRAQEQLIHLSERNSELAAQVKQLQQDLHNVYVSRWETPGHVS